MDIERFCVLVDQGFEEVVDGLRRRYGEVERPPGNDDVGLWFATSDFFRNRVTAGYSVEYKGYTVWILTGPDGEKRVVKMYIDKDAYQKTAEMQSRVYMGGTADTGVVVEKGELGCKILERLENEELGEWFIVSEYGGVTLNENTMTSADEESIDLIISKLNSIGLDHEDVHGFNFVVDQKGHMRVIDYDSIVSI